MALTPEEHLKRHQELHKSLDELLADFMQASNGPVLDRPIEDLMKWSHLQTLGATGPDPLFEEDGDWWFWDETGTVRLGPYATRDIAQKALDGYARLLSDTGQPNKGIYIHLLEEEPK